MLLRSSSTPVLGSLLTSFSDSPNNNHHRHLSESNTTIKHPPTTIHHIHNKPPLHQTVPLNLTSVSCNSSPQFSEHSYKGFRRAQSEGNLEGLAYASCNSNDKVHNSIQPQKFSGRPKCSMLQPIPSFSLHSSIGECEDEEAETDQEELNTEKLEENDEFFERSVDGEDKFMAMEGSEFNWDRKMNMGLVEEKGFKVEFGNMGYEKERELVSSGMYLARGLGVSGGGFGGGSGGGGNDFTPRDSGGDGGDGNRPGMEDYYRRWWRKILATLCF
ncbi:hypothetical protein L1049_005037 [Liquidambar formosana]|uniref:Uncharacterized protein n=1 Tax=Liquidambar formosana TaxID=63359 RepID=A0AAP0RUD8_LIQFO